MVDKKFKLYHDLNWSDNSIGRWETNPDDILCCLEDEYYYNWYYQGSPNYPLTNKCNTYKELKQKLKNITNDK